jgi:hypothetical protein
MSRLTQRELESYLWGAATWCSVAETRKSIPGCASAKASSGAPAISPRNPERC